MTTAQLRSHLCGVVVVTLQSCIDLPKQQRVERLLDLLPDRTDALQRRCLIDELHRLRCIQRSTTKVPASQLEMFG